MQMRAKMVKKFVSRFIYRSKPTSDIFFILKNPKLRDMQMQTRNVKELSQAIVYAWKLINNKIDSRLLCYPLLRKTSIRNQFANKLIIRLTLSYFVTYSLRKLPLEINLHDFIIVILCFIKKYETRYKLKKKSPGKLN